MSCWNLVNCCTTRRENRRVLDVYSHFLDYTAMNILICMWAAVSSLVLAEHSLLQSLPFAWLYHILHMFVFLNRLWLCTDTNANHSPTNLNRKKSIMTIKLVSMQHKCTTPSQQRVFSTPLRYLRHIFRAFHVQLYNRTGSQSVHFCNDGSLLDDSARMASRSQNITLTVEYVIQPW